MQRFRHFFLLRAVLIVLLAWTGADLLVPELCAAEAPVPGITADEHEDHGGPAASNTAQTGRESTTREDGTGAPLSQAPAQDDCFCCCQTVETVTLDLTLGAPTSLPLTDAPKPRVSPGVLPQLFHPPLSL